jgi:hypothetical protein
MGLRLSVEDVCLTAANQIIQGRSHDPGKKSAVAVIRGDHQIGSAKTKPGLTRVAALPLSTEHAPHAHDLPFTQGEIDRGGRAPSTRFVDTTTTIVWCSHQLQVLFPLSQSTDS